jgi:hypothetical protein
LQLKIVINIKFKIIVQLKPKTAGPAYQLLQQKPAALPIKPAANPTSLIPTTQPHQLKAAHLIPTPPNHSITRTKTKTKKPINYGTDKKAI